LDILCWILLFFSDLCPLTSDLCIAGEARFVVKGVVVENSENAYPPVSNLILSGGQSHSYEDTSKILSDVLQEINVTSRIEENCDILESSELMDFDMLTLNCMLWSMEQKEVENWEKGSSLYSMTPKAQEKVSGFFSAGKGLHALHAAPICFDTWNGFPNILGAVWKWNRSAHAPYQAHSIRISRGSHPIVEGLEDFTIMDELYHSLELTDDVQPLIVGDWDNKTHPLMWVRKHGTARVCYNALGHGEETFNHPAFQELLRRGTLWVNGLSFNE